MSQSQNLHWLQRWMQRHPVRTQRLLEIFPGVFSWSLILFPVWGSFLIPQVVAYYVIIFAVYWLYRSATLAVLTVSAHLKIKAGQNFDWLQNLQNTHPDHWSGIHHLVIIPTYQEPVTTLKRTLAALAEQSLPKSQVHVMISFEEREGEAAKQKATILKKRFGEKLGHVWTTLHPDIEGEVKGKSSNTAWGARRAKELLIDHHSIDPKLVTISSVDADVVLPKSYLAALTHHFLTSDERYNRIWQGAILFYNNIWRVPTPVRVMSSVFSITNLFILMRKDRLINFSTYSTSLQHIIDIDYWDTDVIPEDYRLFFKSYFAKKGRFEVEPIYLPVLADAAEARGFWRTMHNQYEQLKRWAWGVSDLSYIAKKAITTKGVPFWDMLLRTVKTAEDHLLWPVNWFAVTVSAMLPPLLNPEFSRTILGKTLPQVTSTLLTLSLVSMVVIFVVDALNRPPRPNKYNPFSYLLQPLEFILLPVFGFFFSALPGIDAHTRLMLGKYIEYRVTEKV